MTPSNHPSDAPAGGAERRETVRHPIEIPIEFTVGTAMLIHVTGNLSARGAYFRRAIPYAVGTRAGLRILLPGEAPVHCAGEVANIPNKQDVGMGVKFLDIGADDARRIEEFARKHGGGDAF